MSLPHRQQRLLRQADRELCRSDPGLASMLSIFDRITTPEGVPAREQLPRELPWTWRVVVWPVAAAAYLLVFVAGGGSNAAAACAAAVNRHALSLRRTLDR